MNARRDAELLIAMAHDVGFDATGIAGVEPLERGQFYLDWLSAGQHAGMDYLKRRVEARLDPTHILDGVASVLCVAMRYAPLDGEPSPDNDLWPRVAKYAHGIDYHDVMVRRLRELAERIQARYPGVEARWYVDTGPVLERELAARAGLGVVGKNTCLLHRDMGSWFLLGELFLTLPLQPSEPLTDLCGRCTLCLDACPTDALLEPYRLDANRCISFWTIEHRGELPPEAREMVGDWVFGCDICQDVCPWNRRRLEEAHHPEFELPDPRRQLDLVSLLGISRDDYVEAFRHSPMKRAKQSGLQRNAAVAMGNRKDPSYLPALSRALREADDPVVRGHAAWALGRLATPLVHDILSRALEEESEDRVREEIRRALDGLADPTLAHLDGVH